MAEFMAKWEKDYLVVRQQLGRLKESALVGQVREGPEGIIEKGKESWAVSAT